jgi:putative ABC transport system permease protein
LGATRGDVIREHLFEVFIDGSIAALIGLGFAVVALRLVRIYFFWQTKKAIDSPEFAAVAQSLSHLDGKMILVSVSLSFFACLLAGLYPAWRIGRMPPATFLKTQ